jgi:DNA primase
MAISRSTIEQITLAADLTSLVGEYVNLKKKGVNWEACCPFHEEKTPSFKVNPSKGIYKCFGCGKGGDAISFVMDIESMSYVEALRHLAKKYNVPIQESETDRREDLERQSEKESLQIVTQFAQDYFKRQLLESDEGKAVGLSYFRERGLRNDMVEAFGLGYAPDLWDGLLQEASKKQYSVELLEKAGLILVNDETKKTYDRFRGRVTFPIFSVAGKVIAFGARMLGSDKNQPKYINSPESPLYDKSQALYGLYQARNAIRQTDMCYLTEGYMDVIAMHQAGIPQTVASSGTSLTEGQIRLVGRFTKNLTLLYDGDKAGIKASLRGIDLIVAAGLNVRAVVLPDGHDPDSYAKAFGSEALQEYLKTHTQDFISFKAGIAAEESAQDPIKRAESLDAILETISLVDDVVRRSIFVGEAAKQFKMGEESLHEALNKKIFDRVRKGPMTRPTEAAHTDGHQGQELSNLQTLAFEEQQSPVFELESSILRSLLLFGHTDIDEQVKVAHYILEHLEDVELRSERLERIRTEYSDRLLFGEALSPDYFLHHPEEELKRLAIDVCAEFYQLSPNWETKYSIYIPTEEDLLSKALFSNILHLKRLHILYEIQELERQLDHLEGEDDGLSILRKHQEKKQVEIHLSKELGTVVHSFHFPNA